MLSFSDTDFIYEPYPIGVAHGVFEGGYYKSLVESFPPVELFKFMPALGNKYSLSELNNPGKYHEYVASSGPWREFHRWLKREEFPYEILSMLCERRIDLGIRRPEGDGAKAPVSGLLGRLKGGGRPPETRGALSARFEFSMLPADGGFIKPHTDSPQKIVTLVIAILSDGEWDQSFGGGTEVLRPRDATQNFNYTNRYLEFDEVETLDTFEYRPNQCVIFIKTFNSLHAVRPMRGKGTGLMRKTLTINIEKVG
jgi:hypothetical protein